MPIDVRSVSLALLALLVSVYMLHWASAVFIPLLLGVMCSYTLSPAVDRMQRWHIPRPIGTAVLLIAVLGGLCSTVYSLNDEAGALVELLPDAAQTFRESLRPSGVVREGPIQKVQRAAAKLEQAAPYGSAVAPAPLFQVAHGDAPPDPAVQLGHRAVVLADAEVRRTAPQVLPPLVRPVAHRDAAASSYQLAHSVLEVGRRFVAALTKSPPGVEGQVTAPAKARRCHSCR